MGLIVRRDPGVASLSRRVMAGTIDVMIWITVPGAGVIIATVARCRWARAHGGDERDWSSWGERTSDRPSPISSTPVRGAWAAIAVGTRNWRSPGMRIIGVRRIYLRTAGPVPTRSAAVRHFAESVERRLWSELNRPAAERAELRRRAADDEIARMREARPDADPEDLNRDASAIRARLRVSCWPQPGLFVPVAINWLWMLRSRRRQLPAERLAGTIVIRER